MFDVYQAGGQLVYANGSCRPWDVRERFLLHVFPVAEDDLAAVNREREFDNLGFSFWTRGVLLEGACLMAATLPEYEIAHVRTGQYISGEGQLWTAEIAMPSAAQQRDAIEPEPNR